ncbi:exodeoxyribonuclease III [Bacteroidia bacterium]|nr:exodeoxyribonuclease III [Bacteroidia bacterium]MDB9882525.1 exodeoxyribonuclease III [Bacteroidia bacterium]MDC1395321.1 exodeoxyribonuclease III [Bacteroidia bacterium]
MQIISWNVNGVRASVKKGLIDIIHDSGADIYCLQETKAQDDQVQEALAELKNFHVYSNSATKKGYSGVAIISKTEPINVTTDMGIDEHDDEGRVICAEYPDFYLINVYVPNSGAGLKRLDYRASWDEAFKSYLTDLQKVKPVIVTGDFNVAHAAIDLKNDKSNYNKTSGYTQKEIDGLDGILSIGLKDSFRELNPEEVKYSFWSTRFNARASNAGWRIDYFLVSNSIMPKVTSAFIDNETFGSDHCPLGLVLS